MSSGQPTISTAIVHSDHLLAEGLAALLARDAIDVVRLACEWGDLIATQNSPFDVVIVDLQLRDGILISTKVRELDALGIATVVISRFTDAISVASAMHAGASAFVATSDSPADLVAAIRTAAEGGQHLADHRASAVDEVAMAEDAGLGRQEERALVLYAGGRSIREVSSDMDTTEETVKSYIKRARRKYRELGVDIGTRVSLRRHAAEQGWLTPT